MTEVAIWRVRIDLETHAVRACSRLLSSAETARAARFRFDRDRSRFIVRRGFLRTALGRHLDADPAGIAYDEGGGRKPELAGAHAGTLAFNVSFSEEIAVCAVTRSGAVGIDVERVQALPDLSDVARTVMTERELFAWKALPEAERVAAFFTLWTRKESIMKADGAGMSMAPHGIEAGFDPVPHGRTVVRGGWRLSAFDPGDRTRGGLAIESSRPEAWRDDAPTHPLTGVLAGATCVTRRFVRASGR